MLIHKFRGRENYGYQKPVNYRNMELYSQFYEMNNNQYDLLGMGFYFAPNYQNIGIGNNNVTDEQIDDTKNSQGGSGAVDVFKTTYDVIKGAKDVYDFYRSEQGTQLKNLYGSYINKHPNWRPGFAGEVHLSNSKGILYNYMGPYTQLKRRIKRGDPPIDELDGTAMEHDTDYSKAKTWEDVRKADVKFIGNLKKAKGSKVTKKIVNTAMRAKLKAEDLGLIKKGSFSSINNAVQDIPDQIEKYGKGDPLKRLMKKYR